MFHIVFFVLNRSGQSLSPDSILSDFTPVLVEAAGGEKGSSGLCWHLCSSFWDFLAQTVVKQLSILRALLWSRVLHVVCKPLSALAPSLLEYE